ncbi:hypothetical protein JTE90_020328 [Oedothorax gibbosus]|uniref:C2H2-type domain-containing protein n=1 Tax=Oedothorax gibbosus TaxID=931172 RepID=A0AAV6VNW9_9ARAC|nr:hypothetical protein JTE90_020328 [Oedothorax gibbosus]
MNIITSLSDFEALFQVPFKSKTILYSLKSDFFRTRNALCKTGEQQYAIDIEDEVESYNNLPEFPCGEKGCKLLFTAIHDYEVHFRSVHSLVCSQCKRSFPTYNMLDVHIKEKHDSYHEAAKDRNQATFDCFLEGCNFSFSSSEQRDSHIIADHNFPPDFKYQNLKKATPSSCESDKMDVEENECSATSSKLSTGARRKPYVPKNICFGRGSARSFSKTSKGKVNRDITMKELADAL